MPDDLVFFRFIVTMDDGNRIAISRLKSAQNYLVLQAKLAPTLAEEELFKKLSPSQNQELISQIRIEVARRNISRIGEGTATYLEKRIPITDTLSENEFIEGIEYMDSTMTIIQNMNTSFLRKNGIVQ